MVLAQAREQFMEVLREIRVEVLALARVVHV
jgi:hypothetical protein